MALQRFEGTSFVDAGLSRRVMSLGGLVVAKTGLSVGTDASTNETVLFTSNLPSKLLNNNGKGLHILAVVSVAANANTKDVRVRMGSLTGTILADTGAVGANNKAYFMEVWIIRTGASSQDVFCASKVSTTVITGFVQTTVNSSSGIQFVVTGQNGTASANDAVLRAVWVDLITEGGVATAGGVLQ